MPQRIEFDGTVHEFPDDFTPADISKALGGHAPAKTVDGFLSNAGTDAVNVAGGILHTLNPMNWPEIGRQTVDSWKNAQKYMEGQTGPISLNSLTRLGGDVANEAYDRPVSTAMTAASVVPSIRLSNPLRSPMQATGRRMVTGALKTPASIINKLPGAEAAGLATTAERIAQDTLDENVNLFREKGRNQVQSGIDSASAARTAAIHSAPQVPVPGSGRAQLDALDPVAAKYSEASQPFAEADTAALAAKRDELLRNRFLTTAIPPQSVQMRDLAPDELLTQHSGSNRSLYGQMGKGSTRDAELEAERAVGQSTNNSLESAVPGTKELGQRMHKLITLRNVGEAARKRAEGRDAFGINDVIALSSGHPAAVAVSSAMRPMAQNAIGKAIYNFGDTSVNIAALNRAALLAKMLGEQGAP